MFTIVNLSLYINVIIEKIIYDISQGELKYSKLDERGLQEVKESTGMNKWLKPLYKALQEKQKQEEK